MNCADDQPLGEAPEIGHCRELTTSADLMERQGKALSEIRQLHELETTMCINCTEPWPCHTIAILDRLGL